MKPLNSPYIPDSTVTAILVSHDIPEGMLSALRELVPVVVTVMDLAGLPAPVRSHPDMQLVIPCEGIIVHSPALNPQTAERLKGLGYVLVPGEKPPAGNYPGDIPYNVAVVGRHAFLNTRYTDPVVLGWLKKTGKTISHVNQGYAKCSVCILNEDAVITSDAGIYRAARANNIDVLLIPPQKTISIPGYEYGFIGGSTGLVSGNRLAFCGDMNTLESAGPILSFLQKHGITPVMLGTGPVRDLGSLIPLCTV
ncbi:MAG: hypothetical protein GX027_04080 [Clostridiaceae bacterium]|nr:hypothetical protein [Clostridiaceae bacterium]